METLKKFVEEEGVRLKLITDTTKEIKKLYGSGRFTYLIDKRGYVRFIQKGVPDNEDFLKQLQLLQ